MTLEELVEAIDADPELPDALVTVGHGEELKAVLRKHLEPVLAERDLMRDAIRLAKQRGDLHYRQAAAAWRYLVAALELDTGSPLVDLSATTEQETEK